MEWTNARKCAEFKREQAKLRKQYIEAGMTEEQIQAMFEYDKQVFNGNRREAEHTQRLDLAIFDDDITDDGQNPLLDKFMEQLTTELDLSKLSENSWVEEIEDNKLVIALKTLPESHLEILTMLVKDRMTKTEIAELQGVGRSAVANKIHRIKKKFEQICERA